MNFRFQQFVCSISRFFCARLKIGPSASAASQNGSPAVRPPRRALRELLKIGRPYGGILLSGDELGHDISMGSVSDRRITPINRQQL
jgi:hypothetical protein